VRAITDEVSEVAGVQKVHAVLDDKTVTVEHSDDVSTAQIVEAIKEAGYDKVEKL
jgi:copper chaperone CopZ